jgi:hypothetical protein
MEEYFTTLQLKVTNEDAAIGVLLHAFHKSLAYLLDFMRTEIRDAIEGAVEARAGELKRNLEEEKKSASALNL